MEMVMSPFITETTEVRPRHRFDERALEDYMGRHIDGFSGSLSVQQFDYGQSNPTFLLRDENRIYVMRKKPPGKLLPSAHAVDREYRIMTALRDTGVPLPKTYALCKDSTIIGTPFYIMELVEGRVFRCPSAPEATGPKERAAIYDSLNRTLARIHRVDWKALGLADFGKPGNYMARQVSRWTKQYEAAKTQEIQSMDKLIRWLNLHIPDDDTTTIVHGDYSLHNMIVHPTEPPIVAVLDWELSTLGHPLADLAYNCLGYYLPITDRRGLPETEEGLRNSGIPTEKDYVAAYCRRTGRKDIPNWNFFMAFSMFRLAAIVQGVYKRGLDGTASSENAQSFGDRVRFLSDTAWGLLSGA